MNSHSKRAYHSETRDAQAAQTKSNIIEAAKTLFQNEGFDKVTINRIAQVAQVSTPTVYALFKSKRGVLQALIDEALPPSQFSSLVEGSMNEKSPKKRLGLTAKLARQMYDAEKSLMDILRSASVVSSEFKELEQERELRRYERQADFVKMMKKDKSLANGLTLEKARDILWTLTGRDLYRMLVVERGWSSEEYEKWLAGMLIRSLLELENKGTHHEF